MNIYGIYDDVTTTLASKGVGYKGFTMSMGSSDLVGKMSFFCKVTNKDLGYPTNHRDTRGDMIFTKHVFIIPSTKQICMVDISIDGDEPTYGISNSDTRHDPLPMQELYIIGVLCEDEETFALCVDDNVCRDRTIYPLDASTTCSELDEITYEGFYLDGVTNSFHCVVTGEDIGSPTTYRDKNGHLIFTKHVLVTEGNYHTIATISMLEQGDSVEYGLSMHHTTHCSIHKDDVMVVGAMVNSHEYVLCKKIKV